MDIRFVNRRNEIINVSNLSIKVMKRYLIGIDERKNVVEIEEYESEERAKEVLREVCELMSRLEADRGGIVIDLRERGEVE